LFLFIWTTYPWQKTVILKLCSLQIIITSPNQDGLQTALNKTLSDINSWFKANYLSPNFNKTYYLQ
jgi:hypothetical protein